MYYLPYWLEILSGTHCVDNISWLSVFLLSNVVLIAAVFINLTKMNNWTVRNCYYLLLLTASYIIGEIAHFLINTTSREVNIWTWLVFHCNSFLKEKFLWIISFCRLLAIFTSETKNGLDGLLASQFPPRGARWTASAGHHASVTTPEKMAFRNSSGCRGYQLPTLGTLAASS